MKRVVSNKLYYIYFVCSVLICIMHVSGGLSGTLGVPQGNYLLGWLYHMGVPAMGWFFFSAAYFLFRSYGEKQYVSLLRKKVKTLVIPYLVWNICGYLWMFLVYHKLLLRDKSVLDVQGALKMFVFLFIPPDKLVTPANGGTWFLARLFSYILLTPILYKLCKKKWSILVVIGLQVLVVCLQINYYSIFYWLPVYMLGAWISLNFKESYEHMLEGELWKKTFLHKSVAILICVVSYMAFVFLIKSSVLDISVARFLAPIVIWWCGTLISIDRQPGWYVRNSNFYMYCFHGLVTCVVIPACWWRLGHLLSVECIFILVFSTVCMVVYGSLFVLRKVLPENVLSVIMGGRVK